MVPRDVVTYACVSTVASPKEKPYYCDAILSTGIDRLDLPTYDPEALMANYEELQEAARIHQAQLQAQQYQQAARDSNWGQPPVPGLEDETPEAQAYDATAGGGDDTWTQAADGSWSQPGGVSWMQQADGSWLQMPDTGAAWTEPAAATEQTAAATTTQPAAQTPAASSSEPAAVEQSPVDKALQQALTQAANPDFDPQRHAFGGGSRPRNRWGQGDPNLAPAQSAGNIAAVQPAAQSQSADVTLQPTAEAPAAEQQPLVPPPVPPAALTSPPAAVAEAAAPGEAPTAEVSAGAESAEALISKAKAMLAAAPTVQGNGLQGANDAVTCVTGAEDAPIANTHANQDA